MKAEVGKKYIVTCSEWFFAPDGNSYRSAWGTVHGVQTTEETLGFTPSRPSTNWYLNIGNLLIAGCHIHYIVQSEHCNLEPANADLEYNGGHRVVKNHKSFIYNADGEYTEKKKKKHKKKH